MLPKKMRGASNLGQILGIRIRLHYTWSAAFVLITAAVVTQFSEAYPLWQRLILGIAASLLFFMAVSIRELALSFVAIRKGIPVKSVTLFVFGGVSQITKESTLPNLELLVAATGFLSSLIIAGIFYVVYFVMVIAGNVMVAGLTQWLAFIYFILALFQLIPGFPLDGGRLSRALLWKATGDYERATRIAIWTGQGIGLISIVGGILMMIVTRQWFVGLFLAFVGWVLQSAAAYSRYQAAWREALQSTTVQDVMAKEFSLITQQLSLGQLVRDYILVTGQRYFIVVDGVKLQGIVTMSNIKPIPTKRWHSTRVGEIMTPADELKTAHPQQLAAGVLEQMDEFGISEMPVLEGDRIVGIVGRDSLMRLVKTRAELGK